MRWCRWRMSQRHGLLDVAAALAAAAALLFVGGAWIAHRRLPAARGTPLGERHAFLAGIALFVSGLSLLVIVAIAATRLALGPCIQ